MNCTHPTYVPGQGLAMLVGNQDEGSPTTPLLFPEGFPTRFRLETPALALRNHTRRVPSDTHREPLSAGCETFHHDIETTCADKMGSLLSTLRPHPGAPILPGNSASMSPDENHWRFVSRYGNPSASASMSPQEKLPAACEEKPASITANEKQHLCFLPAHEAWRAGEISWEQYLHYALLHWTGSTHAFDNKHWTDTEGLYNIDPVGFAFWQWQHEATGVRGREPHLAHLVAAKWEAVPNIDDLKAVFQAYATDRPEEVEAKLSVLTNHTSILLQRVLCLLSLQQKKLGILDLCLRSVENGLVDAWPPNRPFQDLAGSINQEKEPELYDILEKSQWASSIGWQLPKSGDPREPL
nr:hypothetical protein CFP56_33603 [Quercus suber]